MQKITAKQRNSDKYRSFYAVRIRMLSVMRLQALRNSTHGWWHGDSTGTPTHGPLKVCHTPTIMWTP